MEMMGQSPIDYNLNKEQQKNMEMRDFLDFQEELFQKDAVEILGLENEWKGFLKEVLPEDFGE